ncbi:MAG: hypothetical protein JWN61_1893 [Pseudonocardiales bacterium]|nr:hypothetical protein [Jatrophihabitantaceae bacterium]MCW2603758.1 hypothetical protein [Pseudonocardiales bacterium]
MSDRHGHQDLLNPPTLLPEDPGATMLASGDEPVEVAAAFPAGSEAWASLAEAALAAGQPIQAYAYARTGYHRGLDALRKAGWRGTGPVPWSHVPNQGVLRAIAALGTAAEAIGETAEVERTAALLDDCDPTARGILGR